MQLEILVNWETECVWRVHLQLSCREEPRNQYCWSPASNHLPLIVVIAVIVVIDAINAADVIAVIADIVAIAAMAATNVVMVHVSLQILLRWGRLNLLHPFGLAAG